ncbi:MAG: hypothetical protein EHM61_15130 [Acidobacteria bacterium]|nr:MAG: hypothetical protein EHM61_15130 [Acidobacteriota bacterium]
MKAPLIAFSLLAVAVLPRYDVVQPGTHPGILFSRAELPALRARAKSTGLPGEAWKRLQKTADAPASSDLTLKQTVGREGRLLASQLVAMSLVYQVEGDRALGRRAIALFLAVLDKVDAFDFHKEVDSDFFATEHWPKAFAFAWDWLYELMTPEERIVALARLERWNEALFQHTESWWWREAGYNCGAIPVGAQGLLLAAIRGESQHPEYGRWHSDCFRKVSKNYFPETWRSSGIANEGPGYAHYHNNPTLFAEAVRRLGGPDIIPASGAVNAMHYLRHQWMPQGGCGPVGDNTGYGRRVFQPIYLHGIRELGDAAGLWTFEKYVDLDRIDPLGVFLLYPDGLKPVSPGTLDEPVSHYFEIDQNRAGYLFARNEWDNEQAHWFVFTTRHDEANHTHYDMNSFLFTAFGDQFATHENIFGYSHPHHGADLEHNIVIVDEGGMPAADRPTSAGDDGSIYGFMTSVVAGHFADYARGDARLSYADRSISSSTPAERADRSVLCVKQGPAPYIVVADDIEKGQGEHDYHWQWYTPAKSLSGAGTFAGPFVIKGQNAQCRIAFHEPVKPEKEFRLVKSEDQRHPIELGLLRVNRRGVRVRYLAVAAASRLGAPEPRLASGPEVAGGTGVASLIVEGEGLRDLIVWQPEEGRDRGGQTIVAGPLKTDALLAMVRTGPGGEVLGYVVGEGRLLEFGGRTLVRSPEAWSVSAGLSKTMVAGPRRARQGLPPLAASGEVLLPAPGSRLWVDGRLASAVPRSGLVRVGK